jgi:hypothetical protein
LREDVPKDAWGRELSYELSTDTGFRLASLGADGKTGGDGANADIVWTRDGEQRTLSADEAAELERRRKEALFQAHRCVALREMVVAGTAVVNFRRERGAWPATLADARPTGNDEAQLAIQHCFGDPWGNPYQLRLLAHENFAIVCLGADGKEGGKDQDADFVITEKEVRPSYLRGGRLNRWGGRGRWWDWRADELASNIRRFKRLVGRLPADLTELTRPGLTKNGQPVIQSLPKDRHGRDYCYVTYGADEFYVVSLGKDGLEGGDGEDSDTVVPEPGTTGREYEEHEPPGEDQDALRAEVAREQALDIADKLVAHHAEKSAYPETLEAIKDKFPGEAVPLDPWDRPFAYALTRNDKGEVTGFTVTCLGRDGASGGEDSDADIVVNEKKETK